MQFVYTADQLGAYVAPASKVLARSEIAEGAEFFLLFLSNLRRLYPEVYGPETFLGKATERREFLLGEGEGFNDATSVTRFIKVDAYAGRFNNVSLETMNNHSPNLTNVYLDTPLVGLTPEPLDYIPSQVQIGQPHRYPLTRRGVVPHTSAPNTQTPPSPTSTL